MKTWWMAYSFEWDRLSSAKCVCKRQTIYFSTLLSMTSLKWSSSCFRSQKLGDFPLKSLGPLNKWVKKCLCLYLGHMISMRSHHGMSWKIGPAFSFPRQKQEQLMMWKEKKRICWVVKLFASSCGGGLPKLAINLVDRCAWKQSSRRNLEVGQVLPHISGSILLAIVYCSSGGRLISSKYFVHISSSVMRPACRLSFGQLVLENDCPVNLGSGLKMSCCWFHGYHLPLTCQVFLGQRLLAVWMLTRFFCVGEILSHCIRIVTYSLDA